jgi:hypothetical protein
MNDDFQNSRIPADRNVTVFADRRKPTDAEILMGLMNGLMERMDRYDERLSTHMEQETIQLRQAMQEVMTNSFPDGDPDGHRRAHEAWIRKEEDKAKFWHEMVVAGAKWLGLGVLGFLATAAWTAFLQGPHK